MRLHWDSEVKGFGLRITHTGAAAWILNFRSHGIERQMTIGSFPDWTTKAAREQAKAYKRLVDQGQDPMADRHKERAAPTMNDLAAHCIATHLPRERPVSQTMHKIALAKHVLPRLGNHKLAAVRHSDIAGLQRKISSAVRSRGTA